MPIVFKAMSPSTAVIPQPPLAPTALTVTGTTSSTASLSWTAPAGGASTYNIYLNGSKIITGAVATSGIVSGLSPSTTYAFNVTGQNLIGEGPQSNTANGTTTAASGSVKVPVGHHTESDTILTAGRTISNVQSEMDTGLSAYPNLLGYMALVTWGHLEPTQGNFNFVTTDAIFNRLKTQYSNQKFFWICLEYGAFSSSAPGANDGSIIPLYIQTNTSLYGASPVAGRSGWWGTTQNGNLYAPLLYRPNIGNAFINMVQNVLLRYKDDPMFAGVYLVEDSTLVGAATAGPTSAGDYSDSAFITFLGNFVDACVSTAPTCNCVLSNSFLFSMPPTQQFTVDLINSHRGILGQTDTLGVAVTHHSWGQGTYVGSYTPTFPDMRATNSMFDEVQATDMGFFGQFSYAPQDILNAMNSRDNNTISFWCIVPNSISGTQSPQANFPALGVFLNNPANALTNTGRPSHY